jgi:hypothetical protein
VLKEFATLALKDVNYAKIIKHVLNVLPINSYSIVTAYLYAHLELYNQEINVLIAMFHVKHVPIKILIDVLLALVHTNYSIKNV